MESIHKIAELKYNERTGVFRNKYALSNIIKNILSLVFTETHLLTIISEYSGTDSCSNIMNATDLFELNKEYDIFHYTTDSHELLHYLNKKYNSSVCSDSHVSNGCSICVYSFNIKRGLLSVYSKEITYEYEVGNTLIMKIVD
jgi:hypothetical protein